MLSQHRLLPQAVAEPLVRGRKNLNVESDRNGSTLLAFLLDPGSCQCLRAPYVAIRLPASMLIGVHLPGYGRC